MSWESWQWKQWRVDKVKADPSLNKAGRAFGKGTTSKARQLKRLHLQQGPHPPQQQERDGWSDDDDDHSWERGRGSWEGGRTSWERDGGSTWWEDSSWQRGWEEGPYNREWGWQSWGWEEESTPIRLKSKSPTPTPRNRARKRSSERRGDKQDIESSDEDDRWDRDRELDLPRRGRLSEIREGDEEYPVTLERGKKARQRSSSNTSNVSLMGVKIWRKKEQERQDWLDQNEKPMHHKQVKQEIKQEKEEDEEDEEEDTPGVKDVKVCQEEKQNAPEMGKNPEETSSPDKAPGMGSNSEEASSSDKKKEDGTTSTSEKRKVMVDFHNTLEVGNVIPAANHAAVDKLLQAQHPVTICSWCFQKREREVMATLKGQTWFGELEDAFCIQQRTGHGGKVTICLASGIQVLMDDAPDICKEAFEKGLGVYPIQTRFEKHQWWEAIGRTAYPTLADAVKAFLEKEGS